MDVVDPKLDPVEDFLVNRKEGHCEYFASALALLLRSIDIPARMVNGFKGGDWNELAQVMNVRQKHAHSWVEAYIGAGSGRATRSGSPSTRRPARSANESVAQRRRVRRRISARSPTWSATSGSSTSSATTPTARTASSTTPIRQLVEEARRGSR